MFIQMVFSKDHPGCHNISNGIIPGNDSKKTDQHAADCSNAVCCDLFEMYKLFIQQCDQRYLSPG